MNTGQQSKLLSVILLPLTLSCNTLLGLDEPTLIDAGAAQSDTLRAQHCVLSSDCTADATEVCIFGVCSPECQSERDCEEDQRCLFQSGENEGAACVTPANAECNDDKQCPEGSTCQRATCRNPCETDADCLDAQHCLTGGCVGIAEANPSDSGAASSDNQDPTKGPDASREPETAEPEPAEPEPAEPEPAEPDAADADTSEPEPDAKPLPDAGDSGAEQPESEPEDGGSSSSRCDEGALRCDANASVTRQICRQGEWVTADPCNEGQLCDTSDAGLGSCANVAEECRGRSPGEIYCALHERITCGADLLTVEITDCVSAQHCQAAKSESSECAVCIQGEFECEGDELRICNPANDDFVHQDDCASGECNALAGACTSNACAAGQRRCESGSLYRCADDLSSFDVLVEDCGVGLCNTTNLTCDACQPNATGCADESSTRSCNSDGSQLTETPCPGDTPYCLGDTGTCVECLGDGDCSPQGNCFTASCNAGTGACSSTPRGSGASCGTDGVCDGSGNCVECVNANECTASNACYSATCSSNSCGELPLSLGTPCAFNGGSSCDGNGNCVECVSAAGCAATNACYEATCSASRSCEQNPSSSGTACAFDGGSYCDGAGNCVECTAPAQCTPTNDCYDVECTANQCSETPSDENSLCESNGGTYCDGTGQCVQCTEPGQCQATNDCYSPTCNGNSCGEQLKASGASCSFDGGSYCDGAGACVECVVHANCGSGEYCSASMTCEDNTPFDIGYTTTSTETTPVSPGVLWATKITIEEDVILKSIGMIGAGGSGLARLMVYTHDALNDAPSSYLSWTSDIGAGSGRSSGTATASANVPLAAGTYWVAGTWLATGGDITLYTHSVSGARSVRLLDYDYSSTPPSTYPSGWVAFDDLAGSLFVTVERDTN